MFVHAYVCMCVDMCMCVCLCVCVFVCMHVCVHNTCAYVCLCLQAGMWCEGSALEIKRLWFGFQFRHPTLRRLVDSVFSPSKKQKQNEKEKKKQIRIMVVAGVHTLKEKCSGKHRLSWKNSAKIPPMPGMN